MREIVLDTETTGLDPRNGDRVVEIGCVELVNHVATGETYHCYINPERDMPEEALAVHGLSEEFLRGHPIFAELADEFLEFIDEAPLVIHNAEFDMKFINAELDRLDRQPLPMSRSIDTLALARRKFPGAAASLDALCRRFDINLAERTQHGALLDARLLAEVYLELSGAKQHNHLFLIDGSGFIFRAYHALPPLTRSDGTPVGAVTGFCNMLFKMLEDSYDDGVTHLAVIFDKSGKSFRNDLYPDYKANRPPAPEDLVPQFPVVREVTVGQGAATALTVKLERGIDMTRTGWYSGDPHIHLRRNGEGAFVKVKPCAVVWGVQPSFRIG